MNDKIEGVRPAAASVAAQEGAALKRRKQFKKMNATIALSSLVLAFIISASNPSPGTLMASPAHYFVWLFILSGAVGVFAEFYFFWLQGKEGDKANGNTGQP